MILGKARGDPALQSCPMISARAIPSNSVGARMPSRAGQDKKPVVPRQRRKLLAPGDGGPRARLHKVLLQAIRLDYMMDEFQASSLK